MVFQAKRKTVAALYGNRTIGMKLTTRKKGFSGSRRRSAIIALPHFAFGNKGKTTKAQMRSGLLDDWMDDVAANQREHMDDELHEEYLKDRNGLYVIEMELVNAQLDRIIRDYDAICRELGMQEVMTEAEEAQVQQKFLEVHGYDFFQKMASLDRELRCYEDAVHYENE